MSPSDDLPYWTVDDLHDADYAYDAVLDRLEYKYRLYDQPESVDADDVEYPPVWEPGL